MAPLNLHGDVLVGGLLCHWQGQFAGVCCGNKCTRITDSAFKQGSPVHAVNTGEARVAALDNIPRSVRQDSLHGFELCVDEDEGMIVLLGSVMVCLH
jgi:hypothetical protein